MSVLCTLRSQWRGLCTVTCPCLCTRARSALSPKRFRYRDVPVFVIVFRDVSVSVYPRGTPCHEVDSSISLSLSLSLPPPVSFSLTRSLSRSPAPLCRHLLSLLLFSLSRTRALHMCIFLALLLLVWLSFCFNLCLSLCSFSPLESSPPPLH